MPRPDYGKRAARYDELRPVDEGWWELFELLVREGDLRGRRVLDVGCGTGRFAAALADRAYAKVWAVDPSPEMLAVARARSPRGVRFKQADAARLPFKDGWFERSAMRLVVHVLDRPRAFAEVRRVLRPDGRLVFATFDPAHLHAYWLNRYFPSLLEVDLARFVPAEILADELRAAGFTEVRTLRHSQRKRIDRETALERIRGRHISTFDLLPEDEIEAGLARAEDELPDEVEYGLEWLVVVAAEGPGLRSASGPRAAPARGRPRG
ncbi:MAG TPA: methyltransferase domain-containing protein [Gaiellaceae bacterium]|nr:methyltransferase domain-containing protein [Gaiellaceae bacterium]